MKIEVKYKKDKRAISKEGYRTFQLYTETATLDCEDNFSKLELDLIKENTKNGVLDLGKYSVYFEPHWLEEKVLWMIEGDSNEED